MPIRLLSNSKVRSFLALFCLLIFLYIVLPKQQYTAAPMQHQSRWNQYSLDIDNALAEEQPFKPLMLGHVYGMVDSHHIPTTIPLLVEYFGRLKATEQVKNFIVIGPDHTDGGKDWVTVSNESFVTKYGELKPIDGLAQKLVDLGVASIEEAPFDPEHSVGSQILVISKIFPGSHVTPIIIKSHTSDEQAAALGKALASLMDENTVIVSSVDFTHYLATDQALPIDQISGQVIKNLDVGSLKLIKADSSHSMEAFMTAMSQKNASSTDQFQVLNTKNIAEQYSDYTTGYVFGFWGTP
jgi:AmmeMemoRadiSam system protein B